MAIRKLFFMSRSYISMHNREHDLTGTKELNSVCQIIGVRVDGVHNTQPGVELLHVAIEKHPPSSHSIKTVYEKTAFDIEV